ncbi:MAG: DUF4175 family protein [Elusimicrobia bacterium]|nr:DUF4175 family protein [Elusimicrobiota bacterium]
MLERMLRRWRFERLRAIALEGTFGFAFQPAAFLLVLCLADVVLSLPQQVRCGASALLAAALLWSFFNSYLRPLSSMGAFDILRAAGLRYPQARAHLAPAWELARCGPGPNVSAELAQEHIRRTEKLLSELPAIPVFPLELPTRSLKRLSAVAAAWAIGLPWLHDGASIVRVIAPWRDVRLETLLVIRPGSGRYAWGSVVDIEAAWQDGRTETPALWIRSDVAWQKADWDSGGPGFAYRIASLTSPLKYQLRHKDLRSAVYALTPVPFAHLSELIAGCRLPGRRPLQEIKLEAGGEIAALRGSWVTLSGRPDRPLVSAELEPSFMSAVKMKPEGEGRWAAGFPLSENGTLKLNLLSSEGMRDPNPVPFPLKALDDQPPGVELLSPSFELEISPRERLPVTFDARDDYGLTSLWLLYRAGAGPENQLLIKRFHEEPAEHLGDFPWDLSRLPAGAVVEFQVKAVDNASPKPQAGYSRKGTLRLVDFESSHARAVALWKSAQERLSNLAQKEQSAAQSMRALAGAPPESCDALQREWAPLEGELLREWDASVQGLDDLAASMREDPYANPGMTQAAGAAAQAVKGLREGELSRARRSEKSGDFASAAKTHESLSSKVRRTAELLKEGQETQALQDLWAEAHRMDQAGAEISEAMQKLAAGGKAPTEAERRKLDDALANLHRQMEALEGTIASLPKAEPGSEREKNRKVYVVPLQSARRALDALSAALARGDYAAAARIAQRLSEELGRVRAALSDAARAQAAESLENSSTKMMEQALELWKEVVEGQSRSLQMTQSIEERRMRAMLASQESLLKELAALQRDVVRDAAELGSPTPPDAMASMQRALKEFEAAQVAEAPQLLSAASQRLRAQAAAIARPFPAEPPPSVRKLNDLAAREDDIRSRLSAGVKAPLADESDFSERMAASAVQGQVRRRTEDLGRRIEDLGQEGVVLPQQSLDALSQAPPEQRSGEQGLNQSDLPLARKHQERALELLEQGMKGLSEALKQQQSMEQSCMSPFSRPRGIARPSGAVRGRIGANTSFVPLPKSQDYQPPREIREEIEKSLRERRPQAFDEIIREYLKKMSE